MIMAQQVSSPFEEQKHVAGQSFCNTALWYPLSETQTFGRIPVHHHYSLVHAYKVNMVMIKGETFVKFIM